jgi:flavin-binding protein dodecin
MKLLRSYFFWTYERGSFHYDVMVTMILIVLFVSPRFIDFKDKPVTAIPLHASEVLVKEQGSSGDDARFIYEIRAEDLHGASSDADLKAAILDVVEPISGSVTLLKYAPVMDTKGHIVAYDATVLR